MAFGLTPDIAMMIYSLARKGINRFDIPDLVKKIEEKHHASHSISVKLDTTTSNRDSANSKKPPLVSEENNPSSNIDKRSDLGDTQVKTDLLSSSDCCPKQKRIEDVVRGGKTSPESHQLVSNQGAQNCGRSQQKAIKKGDLTKVVSTNAVMNSEGDQDKVERNQNITEMMNNAMGMS
jgi:hypothetical protein